MAQNTKKRKRKHRGTPAGTVQRPAGRAAAPKTREQTRKAAQERRQARLDKPPEWRSSINRAAIAAVVFSLLALVLGLGGGPLGAVTLGIVMFLLYIPMGYGTDMAVYRFRQRRKAAPRK